MLIRSRTMWILYWRRNAGLRKSPLSICCIGKNALKLEVEADRERYMMFFGSLFSAIVASPLLPSPADALLIIAKQSVYRRNSLLSELAVLFAAPPEQTVSHPNHQLK